MSAASESTVLVTGGNSGIGFECARALARAGRHVIIASRNRRTSDEAVRKITGEHSAARIEAVDLDLASPASIRRVAADIEARDLPLQSLVCNAGLQFFGKAPVLSDQGYELTFAVNHLGHFLLTNLLLARLARNAPARIVIVSSGVHDPKRFTGMPKANITDLATLAATGCASADRYNGGLAYVNSKLCNLWFAYELARRVEAAGLDAGHSIAINAFDPGLVPGSGLAREYPPALRFVWESIMPAMASALTRFVPGINTAEKSGKALADLVLDPRRGDGGVRYYPSHTRWLETPSSDQSYDVGRAGQLWDASIAMTGLAVGESPLLS